MHIDWAATGAWASFFATVLMGAFIYGRLTQQVKTNSEDIRELKGDFRAIGKTVNDHTADIAGIKAHLGLEK